MAVEKRGEGNGSPFELLTYLAYTPVPAFDYRVFVGENEWILNLVAAAGKAGGFTMEVVEENVPEDFRENANPVDVVNLIEFMNQYSEQQGWPPLVETVAQPEEEEPEAKRPYHRKKKTTAKRKQRRTNRAKKAPKEPRVKKSVRKPRRPEAATTVRTAGSSTNRPGSVADKVVKFIKTAKQAGALTARHGSMPALAKYLTKKIGVKVSTGNLTSILARNFNFHTGRKAPSEEKNLRRPQKPVQVKSRSVSGRPGSKHDQLVAKLGGEAVAAKTIGTLYQNSGNQTKAAAAVQSLARDKGLSDFKLSQRELCDTLKKLGIKPLHPGRRPAQKEKS
ncbi:MAG: hypothetical protein WC544_03035 [Patescibacteria group bacterium]